MKIYSIIKIYIQSRKYIQELEEGRSGEDNWLLFDQTELNC